MFNIKIKNKRIKHINCVNCGKFCQNNDLKYFKNFLSECKKDGFEGIILSCEKSVSSLKALLNNDKEILDTVNFKIKNKSCLIELR